MTAAGRRNGTKDMEPEVMDTQIDARTEFSERYLEGLYHWKHYKDDRCYYKIISDVALMENTKERAVIYQHRVTKQIWIRSFADFHALVPGHPTKDGFVPRFT